MLDMCMVVCEHIPSLPCLHTFFTSSSLYFIYFFQKFCYIYTLWATDPSCKWTTPCNGQICSPQATSHCIKHPYCSEHASLALSYTHQLSHLSAFTDSQYIYNTNLARPTNHRRTHRHTLNREVWSTCTWKSTAKTRNCLTLVKKVEVICAADKNPGISVLALTDIFQCGKTQVAPVLKKKVSILTSYNVWGQCFLIVMPYQKETSYFDLRKGKGIIEIWLEIEKLNCHLCARYQSILLLMDNTGCHSPDYKEKHRSYFFLLIQHLRCSH